MIFAGIIVWGFIFVSAMKKKRPPFYVTAGAGAVLGGVSMIVINGGYISDGTLLPMFGIALAVATVMTVFAFWVVR